MTTDLHKYTLETARILHKNADEEAAKDLAQDAMFCIYRAQGRGTVSAGTVNRTFAAKVTRRLYLNRKRDNGRRVKAQSLGEVEFAGLVSGDIVSDPSAISPERATVTKMFYASVMAHIAKLPRRFQESLLLFAGGMTCGEIARHIGVSLGVVKKRIYVARQRLLMAFPEGATA